MTLPDALQRLVQREDLSRQQARALLESIFAGNAGDAEVAGLLVALAMKGETVEEIVGFAQAMRAAVADIGAGDLGRRAVDTCGTGGSVRNVFNISTAAAFVAAGAGQPVAKHGNRTSTSVSGSADVLEALGFNLDLSPLQLGDCLRATGFVFLFAPRLHGAMRHVMPARRALKLRTVFNLLGPLTNPAGADAQIVGVPSQPLIATVAAALLHLGTRHSFVVRAQDGLGEFSTTALNDVAEIRDGRIATSTLDARDLGLPRAQLADIAYHSHAQAAAQLRAVLNGEPGPRRDIVLLNAAAALVAGGRAADLAQGLQLARDAIASGAALAKLQAAVAFTQSAAAANPSPR